MRGLLSVPVLDGRRNVRQQRHRAGLQRAPHRWRRRQPLGWNSVTNTLVQTRQPLKRPLLRRGVAERTRFFHCILFSPSLFLPRSWGPWTSPQAGTGRNANTVVRSPYIICRRGGVVVADGLPALHLSIVP